MYEIRISFEISFETSFGTRFRNYENPGKMKLNISKKSLKCRETAARLNTISMHDWGVIIQDR